MIKKLFLVSCLLFLVAFLSGCVPSNQNYPLSTPSGLLTSACYLLEEGVAVQIDSTSLTSDDCKTQLDGKIYVRIRQQVRIVNAKITEGRANTGTCRPAYTGSLREVGKTTIGQRVFWESENHLKNDLTDFILVFLKEEKGYHHFDIYIDQAKKNEIPDFVKNCQETGGLIPMVEGPDMSFPPQWFEKTKIDKTGYEANFAKYQSELTDYYVRIQPVEQLPAAAEQIGKYSLTIDQTSKTYDVFFHAATVYLREGTDKPYLYNSSETAPPFVAKERDPSLQLGTLQFISTAEWTWATPECKPVIYFYPEKPTKLNIKLNPAGYLTETDPPYDSQKGWEVIAYPDGSISLLTSHLNHLTSHISLPISHSYPYLHYEALIEKFQTPERGWVIRKKELPEFFEGLLPNLGLNEKEADDFKNYWLGRLTKSPYYLVSLLPREEIERIEPVDFSIQPDTFIRVRLYFKDLDKPALISPPELAPLPERKGFTVVEWGGLYKN